MNSYLDWSCKRAAMAVHKYFAWAECRSLTNDHSAYSWARKYNLDQQLKNIKIIKNSYYVCDSYDINRYFADQVGLQPSMLKSLGIHPPIHKLYLHYYQEILSNQSMQLEYPSGLKKPSNLDTTVIWLKWLQMVAVYEPFDSFIMSHGDLFYNQA